MKIREGKEEKKKISFLKAGTMGQGYTTEVRRALYVQRLKFDPQDPNFFHWVLLDVATLGRENWKKVRVWLEKSEHRL